MSQKTKYALGIFEEGQNLYVASLVQDETGVKVVSTEIYSFDGLNQSAEVNESAGEVDDAEALLEKEAELQDSGKKSGSETSIQEAQLSLDDDDIKIDDDVLSNLQQDVVSGSKHESADDFLLPGLKDESFQKYPDLLYHILNKSPKSPHIAFSFQEPKVYYTPFFTDWGLTGDKLKQKVKQELSTEKPDFGVHIPDEVGILKAASGDIISVSSDVISDFRSIIKEYHHKFKKHLPPISFIECDVVSLVNLINLNYEFNEDEISVIIYVGVDTTRIIFMQGNNLLHISPVINEGTDSILIFETIYNKVMLEQDNLNLSKIDRIFTTGEAGGMGVKSYLASMFPGDVKDKVEEFSFQNLFVYDKEKFSDEHLAQFAVPIGAAWRALDKKNEKLLNLDLIPSKIRESQKFLKLGLVGWVTFIMIFVLTMYFSMQIAHLKSEIQTKNQEITIKQGELEHLQDLDKQLTAANAKLDQYKKTYSVLDSMLSHTKDYNDFLASVSNNAKRLGGIWISDITPEGTNNVTVKGYSLYRNRIANFSETIGETTLKMVETSEIRDKTVYRFTLTATVPYVVPFNQKEVAEKLTAAKNTTAKKIDVNNKQSGTSAGLTINSELEFQSKYEDARAEFNKYNYRQAIKEFTALIESGFNSYLIVNCYYWIGESYFGLGEYDKAIENLKYVSKRESKKKTASIFMIGRSYAKKGDSENSKRYMDQLINEYPDEPMARKASNFKRRLR